jgi:hypothetical protein
MGNADRTIRLIIVAIILGMYAFGYITGVLSVLLLIVAAIFLLTSIVNFCPLYTLLGIKTCKTNN